MLGSMLVLHNVMWSKHWMCCNKWWKFWVILWSSKFKFFLPDSRIWVLPHKYFKFYSRHPYGTQRSYPNCSILFCLQVTYLKTLLVYGVQVQRITELVTNMSILDRLHHLFRNNSRFHMKNLEKS